MLLLRNPGLVELWVDGEGEFPAGWQLATSLRHLQIPAGGQRAFPVVVRGDPQAPAGTLNGNLRFRDADGAELATLPLRAQVPARPQLTFLRLDAPLVSVDAPLRLEVVLRNLGNVTERVWMEGSVGVRVEPPEVLLERGASRTLRVTWNPSPEDVQRQGVRIDVSARGDGGGAAELRHSVTLLTTHHADGGPWHTLPSLVSLSARGALGGTAGWAGVRIGLSGGGRWRDGSPATLRYAFQSDLEGERPQGCAAPPATISAPPFAGRLCWRKSGAPI